MSTQTSPKAGTQSVKESLGKIESSLEEMFKKAPALPDGVKEFIVTVSPWLAILGMLLMIPAILMVLGVGAFFAPVSILAGATVGFKYIVGMIFSIAMIVLELMAIPGLFKRKKSAWQLMFYVSLLSIVQNVVMFEIMSLIIGGLISFYILFQVKEKYTN